jgi:hypothetical protein
MEDKEKKFKRRIKWALKDPIRYRASTLYHSAKKRAKSKNIPFDITLDCVHEKLKHGYCEVTNIPFVIKEYTKEGHKEIVHAHSPSLDKIDSTRGYTKDNVQIVIDQYNKMKGDRDLETTIFLARKLIEAYERRNINLLVR